MRIWPFKRNSKWTDEGWEVHPCELPHVDVHKPITRLGQVWRCFCGRRFKLVAVSREQVESGETVQWNEWSEVLPATPLTEEEFARLLEDTDGTA